MEEITLREISDALELYKRRLTEKEIDESSYLYDNQDLSQLRWLIDDIRLKAEAATETQRRIITKLTRRLRNERIQSN